MNNRQLKTLLEASAATDTFKKAVENFENGLDSDCIAHSADSPKVKVLRVIMKLIDTYPQEKISKVNISGQSSCSGYAGKLSFEPAGVEIEFDWDCYWKAEKEGMTTWYGQPDQLKAAQKFGYQCFKKFASPETTDKPDQFKAPL